MTDIIKKEAMAQGIKIEIIPIERLSDIKADVKRVKQSECLNAFQTMLLEERYVLDVPKLPFSARSIVIAAADMDLAVATFNHNGKQVHDILEFQQTSIKEHLERIISEKGFHIEYIHWLPQKLIAVRSGLAEYGRNNICYIDGRGSFIELATFIADVPCGDYHWQDVKHMDICDGCHLCLNNCPTGAILPDRFLIDSMKCLPLQHNERVHTFPEWVPKAAHHRVFGCLRCQDICPANIERLNNIYESVIFTEEETLLLLAGERVENMPQSLFEKIDRYNIWYIKRVPKNLKAMFANDDIVKYKGV